MNPPVFPSQYLLPENQGISLRDYFAARALQTFLLDKRASMQDNAIDAYKMADAMLDARQA